MKRLISPLVCLVALFGLSMAAHADSIPPEGTLQTTIYGDARDENPGDLAIDIRIDWSVNADGILTANWNVKINPDTLADYAGDNLRIKAFGFNLNYDGDVMLSGFDPSAYDALTDHKVAGTGGTIVEFLACAVNGGGNNCGGGGSVTSEFNFVMTLDCRQVACDDDLFTGADMFDGDYIYGDGLGQLAAHIIGFDGGCSGAVGGLYDNDGNTAGDGFADGRGECGSISVPEPGTLSLLGAGLLGMALLRRRRKLV